MIDRLAEQFKHCGFAYGYDLLAEQHIIQLGDDETLYADAFRLRASQELGQFIAAFPDEALLFIDAENEIPLEPPILYRVQPTHETAWGSYQRIEGTTVAVTFDEWTSGETSTWDIVGSVSYGDEITQRTAVSVAVETLMAASPNYAMAA